MKAMLVMLVITPLFHIPAQHHPRMPPAPKPLVWYCAAPGSSGGRMCCADFDWTTHTWRLCEIRGNVRRRES